LRVTPANHFVNWQQDPQSNWLARIVFPERARELKLEVDLIAEMSVINPFDSSSSRTRRNSRSNTRTGSCTNSRPTS